MRVKTHHNLQPAEQLAHTVVIEDDNGNPIFVALHMSEGIVYSDASQKDFPGILKLAGIETVPVVTFID
jgi:hypothetical protein